MKILECSSKGDIRFSAFGAKVKVLGKLDTIENHYQLSKRFLNEEPPKTWREAKGKTPINFVIGDKIIDVKYIHLFYKSLWFKYLESNPELVCYAKEFDEYNDIFKSKKSPCCQADEIRQYVKEGREIMLKELKPLIELLK